MARKRRKHKKSPVLEYRRLSTPELHQRIEERYQRGDLRAAIDIAKECYRRDPSPAHGELLGDAYRRRARQLLQKELYVEAKVVLGHAQSVSHASPELLEMAFECAVRRGEYASAMAVLRRMEDSGVRARALGLLAEEAVAGGERLRAVRDLAMAEDVNRVLDDAARIRRAFSAFERGEDQAATAELKPIGLRSPCAGWKWILRGLAAYGRGEEDNARTSWGHVGAEGRAGKLAGLVLSVLANRSPSDSQVPPRVRAKLASCLGNTRIELLQQIKVAQDGDDPAAVMELCGRLLGRVAPEDHLAFGQRLGRAICESLEWSQRTVHRFARTFGRLPEDPELIRLAALQLEAEDPEEAVLAWQAYLARIQHIEAIPAGLRSRARAMIWRRLGDLAERIMPDDLPVFGHDFNFEEPLPSAVTCYRNGLREYADDLEMHEKLLAALEARGEAKQAERQAEEILKRWPTHVPSLLSVGQKCFDRNAYRKALNYFARAQQAEPFNGKIRNEMQSCLLFSARRRLDNGNLKLARKDYEQAEALRDLNESSLSLYCKWAALEWRAGETEKAESLFAKAKASGDHPLLMYYQMAIELDRAHSPPEVQDRFEKLLAEAWQGEPAGAAAAAVVGLTLAHQHLQIFYSRYGVHLESLMDYLRRASKSASFSEEQLLVVCHFLDEIDDCRLLESYAKLGADQFAGNYFFPLFLGRAQSRGGRRRLPRATRKLLKRAGQQASEAGELKLAAEISLLLAIGRRGGLGGLMEVFGFPPGLDEEDDFAELLGAEEEEDEVPFGRRRRRRRRRRHSINQLSLFEDLLDPDLQER